LVKIGEAFILFFDQMQFIESFENCVVLEIDTSIGVFLDMSQGKAGVVVL